MLTPSPFASFLDDAREWARDRIRILKGGKSRSERRHELYCRASKAAQQLSLAQVADRTFQKLERSGRNADYILQLQKLFWKLSVSTRSSPLRAINIHQLAKEITGPDLPIMQSRALQSFIGQLYARIGRWYAPVGQLSDKLNRNISAFRRKQGVPHPRILKIGPAQYSRFLRLLGDEDEQWREALALKFYFETGAKMRRVLRARWDQLLEDTWYPYSHAEREFWFVGRERLDASAKQTLQLAREKLAAEGRTSAYVFPRKDSSEDRPITTARRYWIKTAHRMDWQELPLSHVVLRYRPRNTPSYLHMYSYLWVPISREAVDPKAVSKFGKLADDNLAF